MTPEEEIVRAGKAKQVLDNELFKEAVVEIEEALKEGRLNAGATDVALRDKLWAQEVALYALIKKLRVHIETGQLAEEDIKRKTALEKFKEFIN